MKALYIMILLSTVFGARAQDTISNEEYYITVSSSIEKHDKRLYNYSERESLLEQQNAVWGTSKYSLSFNKHILTINKLNLFAGIGARYEVATFRRPFNHLYFKKDDFKVLRYLDEYTKLQLQVPLEVYYPISGMLYANANLRVLINTYKTIDNSQSTDVNFPYTESKISFNSVEIESGLRFNFKPVFAQINIRCIKMQNIDEIIFNRIIKYPRIDNAIEFHNPLALTLVVGYQFQ